jgi:hypothetical protein
LADNLSAHAPDNNLDRDNLDHEAENNLTEHDAANAITGQCRARTPLDCITMLAPSIRVDFG